MFTQRDKNLIQMWMKLLKEYDVNIQYHPSKSNVVVGILNQKALSMGSVSLVRVSKQPLAREL